MPLNKYRVLSKIAETGKMNKAAQELVYSKPNMSRIIKTMEEEYGFSLLVRTRDGVQLTENARKLLPIINKIIEDENELLEVVSRIQENEDGIRKVRIGAVGSGTIDFVQESVKKMESENAGITVDVRYFFDGKFFYEGVKNGDVDFCLIIEGYHGDFNFEPILKEHYYAVLPPGHELADRGELSYKDIKDYSVIMTPDCPFMNDIMGTCDHKCLVVDDELFGFPIIERGEAIGILSGASKYAFGPHFTAIPLQEKDSITLGIATSKDRELTPAAKKLKAILVKTAEELYK